MCGLLASGHIPMDPASTLSYIFLSPGGFALAGMPEIGRESRRVKQI